jgi:hypothetical protein
LTRKPRSSATVLMASFRASFLQGELSGFARELQTLHKGLKGKAILAPLEPNLELSLVGDGRGYIEITGSARAQFHTKTELSFCFGIDQTYLPDIAKGSIDLDTYPQDRIKGIPG